MSLFQAYNNLFGTAKMCPVYGGVLLSGVSCLIEGLSCSHHVSERISPSLERFHCTVNPYFLESLYFSDSCITSRWTSLYFSDTRSHVYTYTCSRYLTSVCEYIGQRKCGFPVPQTDLISLTPPLIRKISNSK